MSTHSFTGDALPDGTIDESRCVLTCRSHASILDSMRAVQRSEGTGRGNARCVALSIRQPWVELILAGRKTIEVRTWKTSHRGTLWLHAGLRIEESVCAAHHIVHAPLARGAIVGIAELEDCIQFDAASWERLRNAHLNLTSFDRPYFGWVLRNPRRISPVPFKGSLGLMTLPLETVGGAHG